MFSLVGYRTLIAAGVAFASELLAKVDITIDADGTTNSIVTLGGILVAIYYKLVANKRETSLKAEVASAASDK